MSEDLRSFRLPKRAEASKLAVAWRLDPEVAFLNHGSFGAAPIAVLDAQSELRSRLENEPLRFFVDEYQPLLDNARQALADFLGTTSQHLAFVTNATTGVNTVLRSLVFEPGDELLTTDHEYNACRNALNAAADNSGARVVVARIPFPIDSPEEAIEAILNAVTSKTRLLLVDHITSQTALVLPLKRIVSDLEARGVRVLVDGAHATGMTHFNLDTLGASFYTGNCHKWLCAPKGAGFLYARDPHESLRPLVISHGANEPPSARSRFHQEFDWVGTSDPTPWLCVPKAIEAVPALIAGGWSEVMTQNRHMALEARRILADALQTTLPCPDEMIGSMAAIPLPDEPAPDTRSSWEESPLQRALFQERAIEVPIIGWPTSPKRWVRVSAQLYNRTEQFEYLAEALVELLPRFS
ncbi:MAG: aminotransferase class V-fold PLP-dependent enzyme [bacterium]|nr:aminotransferase class V-fold PLP-dependent enzyme [bacterium]